MAKKVLSKVYKSIICWLDSPAGLVRSYYFDNNVSFMLGEKNH